MMRSPAGRGNAVYERGGEKLDAGMRTPLYSNFYLSIC